MIAALHDAWRRMRAAVEETAGTNRFDALRDALRTRPLLVIAASGNSAYPARYLEWLLESTGTPARLVAPLEYALAPPPAPHCCLLISQGARRRDSFAMLELARRHDVPFFLMCGTTALELSTTVAAELPRDRVFTTSTLGERAFLNLIGTAAAFAAGYELAAALGTDLPPAVPASGFDDGFDEGENTLPPVVLHGPAGRCAAEAFAGYHNESLGPVPVYDMKNFTHGVWRGLKEAGRHAVYLVADRRVRPLAQTLRRTLEADHACVTVEADEPFWAIEPFELFVRMTAHWIQRCDNRARIDAAWSPLAIDRSAWPSYLELTKFDVSGL